MLLVHNDFRLSQVRKRLEARATPDPLGPTRYALIAKRSTLAHSTLVANNLLLGNFSRAN